ncbi:hypothetical protein [Streptomyces venezuelae]|uniref:hypothetical protein n=1 Tax=Streptomyces venezuelae TaxID=54571 RepID=UPI003638C9EA
MTALSPSSRFRDPQLSVRAFVGTVLVRCPRCAEAARVVPAAGAPGAEAASMFAERSLVCRGCGLARRHPGERLALRFGAEPVTDPYFGLPLWLQTETRHGLLWAYNPEHLTLIRQFVEAPLREHAPWHEPGARMSLIARLPAWIKRAKNRTEVLRGIGRLRASLAG